MRKSLFLTSYLVVCLLLSSCQSQNIKKDTIKESITGITNDSLTKSDDILQDVSAKKEFKKSTESVKKNTKANSSNSTKISKTKTVIKRIEHGSKNNTILDSIKKEKGKLKNL